MELLKPLLLSICLSSLVQVVTAQELPSLAEGLLKANLTVCPGYLLKQQAGTVYLHGELEYFPEKTISLKGDFFYYLSGHNDNPTFKINHTVLTGGIYHFRENRVIPFVGIQPGLNITRTNADERNDIPVSKTQVSPVFSSVTGINFIFHKNFNFYCSLNYINGKLFADLKRPESLNELRISAGLGFNLFTR